MRFLGTFVTLVLILVLALVTAAPAAPAVPATESLHYTISYIPSSSGGTLRIVLTFRGDRSGRTKLVLPSEWGGQDQLYLGIRALRVETAEATLADTGDATIKLITHNAGTPLRITYTVERDRENMTTAAGRYYRPVLMPGYFFVIGQALWVYPESEEGFPRKIELNWSGLPMQWKPSNSFGIGETRQNLTISVEQLRRGVYMSGDFRVITQKVHGRPMHFATRGLWPFGDQAFVSMCTRIINEEREFFDDYAFPFFLVTMLPTDDSPGNVAGEARAQGFSLFVSSRQADLNGLAPLFAHEMFHVWNPGRMGGLGRDERLYWFSEGFTEYFASVLLQRIGMRTEAEHVQWVNRVVADYTMSPARNLAADEMIVKRRSNGEAEHLPYMQGTILALNWTMLLKNTKGQPESLDDVMRALFRTRQDGPLAVERIASAFGLRSNEIREQIRHYIEHGETIQPSVDAFVGWELTTVEMHEFDPGFDLNESHAKNVFVGVRPDGPAAAAGIRNGQRWVSGGITRDADVEAEFVVEDNNGARTIKYYPRAVSPRLVPQYKKLQ
jgi:predicted metalloprotease with PDZ domain